MNVINRLNTQTSRDAYKDNAICRNELHLLSHFLSGPVRIRCYCTLTYRRWIQHLLLLSAKKIPLCFLTKLESFSQNSRIRYAWYRLSITWHQPSLRIFMLPWNLRTSEKTFAPSGPMGLYPNSNWEKEYVIKPKSEKKKRLLDGEEHTTVTIELSFNAEAIAPTPWTWMLFPACKIKCYISRYG